MTKTLSFGLGGFVFKASVSRKPDACADRRARKLELSYIRVLEDRFPFLRDFGFTPTEKNVREIAAFYARYLPMKREESQSAAVRSLLNSLRKETQDEDLSHKATLAIAASDLADGLAERSTILSDRENWRAEAAAMEAAYGAGIISGPWRTAGRGATLRHYFSHNRTLLAGRDVLHFAPESELESYLRSGEIALRSYTVTDGQTGTSEHHDITEIRLPTNSFDVVICHRVMEHVLDDRAGFAELFRVLRPGGMLNFSVPQMPHRPKTKEWAVPDMSHDGHVRQYGADLAERIVAAGFSVKLEPWLLQRPTQELVAVNAYPMRMFNCFK